MFKKRYPRPQGTLIAFEGISGSGKSESLKSIYTFLCGKNQRVTLYEWNNNPIIRSIAGRLQKTGLLTPNIYAFIQWIGFVIDYTFVIKPKLHKGCLILADRYTYTGLTRDAANGAGIALGLLIHKWVRQPDILLFFDTDPQICFIRGQIRGKKLFYPHHAIPKCRLLQNKDLYYLRKIRRHYIRLIRKQPVAGQTEIVHITSALPDSVNDLKYWLWKKISAFGANIPVPLSQSSPALRSKQPKSQEVSYESIRYRGWN